MEITCDSRHLVAAKVDGSVVVLSLRGDAAHPLRVKSIWRPDVPLMDREKDLTPRPRFFASSTDYLLHCDGWNRVSVFDAHSFNFIRTLPTVADGIITSIQIVEMHTVTANLPSENQDPNEMSPFLVATLSSLAKKSFQIYVYSLQHNQVVSILSESLSHLDWLTCRKEKVLGVFSRLEEPTDSIDIFEKSATPATPVPPLESPIDLMELESDQLLTSNSNVSEAMEVSAAVDADSSPIFAASHDILYFWCHKWILRLDVTQLLKIYQFNLLQVERNREIDNVTTTAAVPNFLPSEEGQICSVKFRFENILCFSNVGRDEFVVVEIPEVELTKSLPPVVDVGIFGHK